MSAYSLNGAESPFPIGDIPVSPGFDDDDQTPRAQITIGNEEGEFWNDLRTLRASKREREASHGRRELRRGKDRPKLCTKMCMN
ncbi:hypothetical protein L596_024772 [Steinernema carpocapsae]|uniref:Uncharacterized protein n=1 Tax=Steinernema carpocapsae TaxID=34508 RepID=A0A4U5M6M1_STECR|nr:hypothetical protein L596_024772 [Steinernema carpocapsae]